MIKKEEKQELDEEEINFSEIILKIRTERKLTQKQLADKINVSDRTISKWEKGITVPDLISLRNICDALEISPNTLIKPKNSFKDRRYKFKRKLEYIITFCLKNIFVIGFIIVFFLLLIYFLNNYNTTKIYSMKYQSDNITIDKGYLINNKIFNYLVINGITLNKIDYTPATVKLELYTYYNGDKYIIYESNNLDNISLEEMKNSADILTHDALNSMKRNLNLNITVTNAAGKEETYKAAISLVDRFSNNKLAYETLPNKPVYDNAYLSFLNNDHNTFDELFNIKDYNKIKHQVITKKEVSNNKLKTLGFTYDKDKDVYTKVDDNGGKVKYSNNPKVITYEKNNKQHIFKIKFCVDSGIADLHLFFKKSDTITVYQYNISSNDSNCIIGNCKNYYFEIDYILSIYKAIKATL